MWPTASLAVATGVVSASTATLTYRAAAAPRTGDGARQSAANKQLAKMGAGLLAELATRVPGLLAGADAKGIAFIDVDDTVREVHGYAKEAAGFGYTGAQV